MTEKFKGYVWYGPWIILTIIKLQLCWIMPWEAHSSIVCSTVPSRYNLEMPATYNNEVLIFLIHEILQEEPAMEWESCTLLMRFQTRLVRYQPAATAVESGVRNFYFKWEREVLLKGFLLPEIEINCTLWHTCPRKRCLPHKIILVKYFLYVIISGM